MSRLRVVLGALFAAGLCICAMGASSASALTLHECKAETGTGVPCEGGGGKNWTPLAGYQTVKPQTIGATVLAATVAGVPMKISCKNSSGSGTVNGVTVGEHMSIVGSGIVANFEECAFVEPVTCTSPATITTKTLNSETVTTTDKEKYVPAEGTAFVTFEVGGASCPAALKGSKSVTGSTTAVINEGEGVQEFTTTSGSEVKYAGQAASFISTSAFKTADGTSVVARTP